MKNLDKCLQISHFKKIEVVKLKLQGRTLTTDPTHYVYNYLTAQNLNQFSYTSGYVSKASLANYYKCQRSCQPATNLFLR